MIEFKSEKNIRQAWKKIQNWALYPKGQKWLPRTTASIDVFHKRQVLEFYLKEEKRLDFLIKKIQSNTFEPTKGDIYYQPKGNNGLRPLVVLSCDDLIYYQAILNVLVELFSDEFTALSDRFIYGNIPLPFKSEGIIKPYLTQYKSFVQQIKKRQDENFIIGESDITSFYEEISYLILKNILTDKFKTEQNDNCEIIDLLIDSLGVWFNPTNHSTNKIKGIPQGVPQSHILANIFLFPLDQKLKREIEYIRYVDDFRIFASSELAISSGFLYLDECLREIGLIKKESKTSISNKYEHDPFEIFYNGIRDKTESNKPTKRNEKTINFKSLFTFNVSPGILDIFDWDELDNKELNTEEKIQDEIFNKIRSYKNEEEVQYENDSIKVDYFGISSVYNISEDVLLSLCEKFIMEGLKNIFTDEELQKKYPKISIYKEINSVKTINFNPLLIEQYGRLINHIFKTVLVIKSRQINFAVCNDFTNYVALQNCINNPWELSQYSKYFQSAINSKKIDESNLNVLLDWLEKQLDFKNPFDLIKYYAFEILSSDLSFRKKAALSEYSLFYMKNESVSWYLKVKAYETYLSINNLSPNPTAVQSSLAHFTDENNTCSSKLVLAQEILNFHKISQLINVREEVRNQEIQNLIELSVSDVNPTLNYFGYRVSESFNKDINWKNASHIYQQYTGKLTFDCFIRARLEKNFEIKFSNTFSFKNIIQASKSTTLQTPYELLGDVLVLSSKSLQENKLDTFINATTGLIEGLFLLLYSKLGIKDDKNTIEGFGYHKKILNKLIINDKFNWDMLLDRIGEIRNKCILSHIRDIKSSEFNSIINPKIFEEFNTLSRQIIQKIIDSFEIVVNEEVIQTVNKSLAIDKINYKMFYDKVSVILPDIEKQLDYIKNKLESLD